MAKPRLEKVEALFYVLKQGAKGGCIRILIHPPLPSPKAIRFLPISHVSGLKAQ